MLYLITTALLLSFTSVWTQDDTHLLSQVLFCQPDAPISGLVKMFDDELMFQYDFSNGSVVPRIEEFRKWANPGIFPKPTNISQYIKRCNKVWKILTNLMVNSTPEAKGLPDMKVFTARPLHLGEPNMLVCSISNVFPPSLTVTWRKNGWEVTEGISSPGYSAMSNGVYQTFSYLNMTPTSYDSYSCNVKVVGENNTSVKYWVPEHPVPSDLLENILCGLAFSFGILFIFLGLMFLYLTRKLHNTD
ncbi:class II histocompatibility antigen, M alpha chain isoform 1-T3 [Discoglossus pictus]